MPDFLCFHPHSSSASVMNHFFVPAKWQRKAISCVISLPCVCVCAQENFSFSVLSWVLLNAAALATAAGDGGGASRGSSKEACVRADGCKEAIVAPGAAEGKKRCGIYLCEGNSGIFYVRMGRRFFNNAEIIIEGRSSLPANNRITYPLLSVCRHHVSSLKMEA